MNMQSFATALVVATFIETTLLMVLKLRQRNPKVARGSILLDTSSIMDGRIVDVARSGIITAEIIIPRSVVRELQLLADKADHDKRLRARKGLDNIRVLQRMDAVSVAIVNDGLVDSGGVDERLLELAQKYDASIATTDYNLNKVAKVINLTVINVNELSQMLRAQLLPGERIEVELIQPGANRDQAVGYLEDGTMVVVEDAKAQIGHRLTVEIVRSLQTEAGRMMFAKKVRTTGQNESGKSKRSGDEAKSTRLTSAFHSDQLAKKRPGRHNQSKHTQANQADGSDDEATKKQPRRPHAPRRQSNSTAAEAEMVRLANK